jgi:hypothetical protein
MADHECPDWGSTSGSSAGATFTAKQRKKVESTK